LIRVCACLAALQGGQAGAGGGAAGSTSAVMPALTPSVRSDGGVGMPRYNAVDAEEGGHGNGLSRREA